MAGKMFFGDPKLTSVFHTTTGTDLTKSDDRLLIICSAPHSIQGRYPSLQIDLVDRVSLTLEPRNIQVISPDDVAAWYDDHGSWGKLDKLAESFDARYIAVVEIRKFTEHVQNSENLLQGTCDGTLKIYEMKGSRAVDVATRPFNVTFPANHPIPRDVQSEEQFLEAFKERVSLYLAQFFYDHRTSETVH